MDTSLFCEQHAKGIQHDPHAHVIDPNHARRGAKDRRQHRQAAGAAAEGLGRHYASPDMSQRDSGYERRERGVLLIDGVSSCVTPTVSGLPMSIMRMSRDVAFGRKMKRSCDVGHRITRQFVVRTSVSGQSF